MQFYYLIIMLLILLVLYFIAKFAKYRKPFIICNTCICLVYILWRVSAIPCDHGIVSLLMGIVLYLAELLGLVAFFNFQYLFIGTYKLEVKTLEDFKDSEIPIVDVLICTYNEPLSLLEMTIAAACDMDYPKERFFIHICDDGRRKELKKLCAEYSVGYITRDNNEGAKAGNINNALKVIQGDLFAVLDADMIPTRNFLKHTVGYFSNPNLSFVQTPQVYYNQDMYQYNLSKHIPNEQDFFMRDIQEARAARNAVLHVGTNAVFRRSFVLEIGGYPTCSITEDMAVGMQLQAHGYDSIFVNEELVYGLSATTFTELVKQRDRWCRGNLQVLKNYNPITTKGLSFSQKIAYLDGGIYWFANIQKMIFIISPLIYLYTGLLVLDCDLKNLLSFYFPYLIGQLLMFNIFSGKTRSMKWAHYYEIVMAPQLSFSIIKEMLNLKTKFNVTSKETVMDKRSFQIKIVIPHIIILILTLVGWGKSAIDIVYQDAHIASYMLNFFWSCYNLMGIVTALRVAWQKPIFRSSERVCITDDVTVLVKYRGQHIQAKLLDISNQGAQIKLMEPVNMRPNRKIFIKIEDTVISSKIIRLSGDNRVSVKYNKVDSNDMKSIMKIFVENINPYYKIDNLLKM